MAGEIEEPFRFNFQADLLHSGSISFGRFESESLSWERRSSFSHNRYLEEVEKYSKPGSVTEKKAYFEAHFKRKALLKRSSSESQDLQESENGNESNLFTCFDESPRSSNHSKRDEETETQKCLQGNVETSCSENVNESRHVTNFNESLCDLSFEGSEIQDQTVIGPEQIKLEETHQSRTDNVVLVKSFISGDASIAKQPKQKLKTHASYSQVKRIISTETSKVKPRESKGLLLKENEKKSPRVASPVTHSGKSPVTHSGRKTSKLEESNMSFQKAKILPPNKSLAKDYRSEKIKSQLPGARQTVNRTKQTFIKPHVNPSAAGFTFKSDQRAAELIQSRKSLNFKATPMPSFYKDSLRSLDQNKVSSAKTPNRPRTSQTTNRISTALSNPRPSSSTTLTNKNHPSDLPKKIYAPEKKKELNLPKQKEPEVTKGTRARDTYGPKFVST